MAYPSSGFNRFGSESGKSSTTCPDRDPFSGVLVQAHKPQNKMTIPFNHRRVHNSKYEMQLRRPREATSGHVRKLTRAI